MTLLILTLAQCINSSSPRATNNIYPLVESTVTAYHSLITRTKTEIDRNSQCYTNNSDDIASHAPPPQETLELVVAGSKKLMNGIAGRDREDWELQWSSGEHVFGLIVREIGLNHFFKNRTGVQSHANLIDVNDGIDYEDERLGLYGDRDANGIVNLDALEQAVADAASVCLRRLRRNNVQPVRRAVIVLPVATSAHVDEERRQQIIRVVSAVVKKCWRYPSGNYGTLNPLERTELEFSLVDSSRNNGSC